MGADALSNTSLQWKVFNVLPVVIPEEQLSFMRGLVASYEEELEPNGAVRIFLFCFVFEALRCSQRQFSFR